MKLFKPFNQEEAVRDIESVGDPVTVEDVRKWAEKNGFALLPVEPPQHVLYAGFGQCFRLATRLGSHKAKYYYKAMIRAAQESSNE